jgi:hypothetical protein
MGSATSGKCREDDARESHWPKRLSIIHIAVFCGAYTDRKNGELLLLNKDRCTLPAFFLTEKNLVTAATSA